MVNKYQSVLIFYIVLILFVGLTSAQEPVLRLYVEDFNDSRLPNIEFSAIGNGPKPKLSDSQGIVRIKLPTNTIPNDQVPIALLGRSSKEWFILQPKNRMIRVPHYDSSPNNFELVVLAQKKVKQVLTDPKFLKKAESFISVPVDLDEMPEKKADKGAENILELSKRMDISHSSIYKAISKINSPNEIADKNSKLYTEIGKSLDRFDDLWVTLGIGLSFRDISFSSNSIRSATIDSDTTLKIENLRYSIILGVAMMVYPFKNLNYEILRGIGFIGNVALLDITDFHTEQRGISIGGGVSYRVSDYLSFNFLYESIKVRTLWSGIKPGDKLYYYDSLVREIDINDNRFFRSKYINSFSIGIAVHL